MKSKPLHLYVLITPFTSYFDLPEETMVPLPVCSYVGGCNLFSHVSYVDSCEPPTSLPFGVRLLSGEGNELPFECGDGLLPQGMVTAMCQPDGTWKPDPLNHLCLTGA